MDAIFPLGLPLATGFYLVFYILTLAIHVVFMNYVLAGSLYLAIHAVRSGVSGRNPYAEPTPTAAILKDWLPVMLSGAITAGIAPLLFVQILYQQGYYTANLLLFNRWMSILPVLIVGFYAMYLVKSHWLIRQANWIVAGISAVPFLCIAFTGYSWTENHLLSVRTEAEWAEFYGTGREWYYEPQLVPRLLIWAFGAIPTWAAVLAWQLWYWKTHGSEQAEASATKLAKLALIGMILTGVAAAAYGIMTEKTTLAAFVGPVALPYFVLATLGLGLQAVGWFRLAKGRPLTVGNLALPSFGLFFTIVGMTVCREALRMAALGAERFESLYPLHEEALGKSGFGWFLFYFLFNGTLIAFCFWLVRTQKKAEEPGEQ